MFRDPVYEAQMAKGREAGSFLVDQALEEWLNRRGIKSKLSACNERRFRFPAADNQIGDLLGHDFQRRNRALRSCSRVRSVQHRYRQCQRLHTFAGDLTEAQDQVRPVFLNGSYDVFGVGGISTTREGANLRACFLPDDTIAQIAERLAQAPPGKAAHEQKSGDEPISHIRALVIHSLDRPGILKPLILEYG